MARAQQALWLQQQPAPPTQNHQGLNTVAYDPVRQRAITIVPVNSSLKLTYEYDGASWTAGATFPSHLAPGALGYHPIRQRMICAFVGIGGINRYLVHLFGCFTQFGNNIFD